MKKSIEFSPLEKALKSLADALEPPPRNDRERDGAIQRFKYTFELAWNTAKRTLETVGISSESPHSVIRALAQQGWITNPETWMDFLDARNRTVHIYKEEVAKEVFESAEAFRPECEHLLKWLKAKAKKPC